MPPARVAAVLRLLTLTALYFAAGKLGLALAFVNASASAVWPPAGIAVAALLLLGTRVWPAITVGAFLVNFSTSGGVGSSLVIATGNTLEAVTAVWLITRWADGSAAFGRPSTTFKFALLGGAVAPTIAASIGVSTLVIAGLATTQDAPAVWLTWWLGDAVGIVLMAPLIVLWLTGGRTGWTRARAIELSAALLTVAALGWLVFGNSPTGNRRYPLEFVAVAVLLWPAFRLGARESALSIALLSGVAIAGTLSGSGPFVRGAPNESLLLLQAFVGIVAVLMLAVASEVAWRKASEAEVRVLNESLERRVLARTEELALLRDRLAEAQSLAHVGSWEWNIGSNSIWWSEELYRIYGLEPRAAITYDQYLAHIHADDRAIVEGTVARALADAQPFSFEHRIIRPDGSERYLHGQGRVTLDDSGRAIRMFGTGHDITERKRADLERTQLIQEQAARREAESSNHAKDLFLAVLSHELRTPLNAALGWTHLLRDIPEDQVPRARSIDAVLRNLHVLVRLVADIMDASHMTLGTMRLERAAIDMTLVTRDAVEMTRHLASARDVSVETDIHSTPLHVYGDAGRLQQVVGNLVDNAVKFSPAKHTVFVKVHGDHTNVHLVVEDQGPGIPADFLPQIFDRFTQADSSVRRRHGGLGLGLAIARHLVEAHGGTIRASNGVAGGAVFTVSLPAA